jgi:hypothetical protein
LNIRLEKYYKPESWTKNGKFSFHA